MLILKITKRILSAITSAVCTFTVCTAALSMGVSAAVGTVGDMTYFAYEDHVEITDCDASAATVVVPEEILNLPVTVIQSNAFEDCTALTQVTVPSSVTTIGDSAFYNCTSLNSITLPDSVTSVGQAAFYNTYIVNQQTGPVYYVSNWVVDSDSATAVEIKSGTVGIADASFYGCGLETVSIPSTVKTVGNAAFAKNTNIREVTVPSGVVSIGYGSFRDCTSLLKISLPSTLTTIGAHAFDKCTSLSGIKIPASVNKIGADAFAYTADYKSQLGPVIYIDSWVVNCLNSQENLAVSINAGTKGIADCTFQDKEFVISATIPSGVKTVGDYAFSGCTSLSQLSLPSTLTTIGSYAFADTRIPSITVPASVTSIGYAAFYNCTNLADITIMNAGCTIYDSPSTIYEGAKMHVADKSTAYNYAIKYNRSFDYVTSVVAKPGDVNGNGECDLYDVIEICKSFMGMVTLTNEQKTVADYNNDGKIDLYDAIAVAKLLM